MRTQVLKKSQRRAGSLNVIIKMSELFFIISYLCLFVLQAKSWSSSVNDIEGVVTDSEGKIVHSIFGKWHESIFQGDPPSATCIWRASECDRRVTGSVHIQMLCVTVRGFFPRPDTMPEEQEQYYGFTQFAMELNELDSSLRPLLPPTDTRLRPDQRSAPLLCDHCYTTTTTTAMNTTTTNFIFNYLPFVTV